MRINEEITVYLSATKLEICVNREDETFVWLSRTEAAAVGLLLMKFAETGEIEEPKPCHE